MLPHAFTSGMCDLHVRLGDQWIVSGLQGSKFIIVQEVFVAFSNFSLFLREVETNLFQLFGSNCRIPGLL